jgi:hypothetical protein
MTTGDTDNIRPLHPLSDEEALAFLQANGVTKASKATLARRWGWSERTVGRRLDKWKTDGTITRRADGSIVVQTGAPAGEPGTTGVKAQAEPATTPAEPTMRGPRQADRQDPASENRHTGNLNDFNGCRVVPGDNPAGVPDTALGLPDVAPDSPATPAPTAPKPAGGQPDPAPLHAACVIEEEPTFCPLTALPARVQDAPPLAPAPAPEHSVPVSATVRAHPVGPDLVAVRPDQVSYFNTAADIFGYAAVAGVTGVGMWFSVRGFATMFPGMPISAMALDVAMEIIKIMMVGFLASHWRSTFWFWRLVLAVLVFGIASINATGVYSQLVAAHVSDRAVANADVAAKAERQEQEIAVTIRMQEAAVADVDRRIALLDDAVAKATATGKTKTAVQIADDTRKARAALTEERKREGVALASLQAQRAQVVAHGHQITATNAAEAAPIVYAAQLLGIDTSDPEQLIRLLIAVIVLCADPAALAFTAAIASRRRA